MDKKKTPARSGRLRDGGVVLEVAARSERGVEKSILVLTEAEYERFKVLFDVFRDSIS